jgi:hypothetical protein
VESSAIEELERLRDLGRQLGEQQRRLDVAFATMAEAMALSCLRLVESARVADFSPPPWPAGIRHTIEVKLAETREVTFRLHSEPRDGNATGPAV